MIKSKRINYFFNIKACDEDEKHTSMSTKLEKFHENPTIEKNEK